MDPAIVETPTSTLRWWEYVAALSPLVLVATIGATGLAVGPAFAALNLLVGRKVRGMALVAVSLVSLVAAVFAWVGMIVILQ
jgi:hypothetical protein